jgi:hypothetical protein
MKYDIIIANPPYKAGLHLKFLDKALDLREEDGHIVFVHPAEWLVQKRETVRTKKFPLIKAKVKGAHIKFINNPWKQVNLWVPLSITHIRGNDFKFTLDGYWFRFEDQAIDNLDAITMIGATQTGVNIVKRIMEFARTSNWKQHETLDTNHPLYLNLFHFCGQNDDFTKLIGRTGLIDLRLIFTFRDPALAITTEPQYSKMGNPRCWIPFTNSREAINAHSFLVNSKLIQVFISILKIDQHSADSLTSSIPWLDWTQEWTDEKLYELFSITEEEKREINKLWALISEKREKHIAILNK